MSKTKEQIIDFRKDRGEPKASIIYGEEVQIVDTTNSWVQCLTMSLSLMQIQSQLLRVDNKESTR